MLTFAQMTIMNLSTDRAIMVLGQIMIGVLILVLIGLITYFKKWRYLWKEWLTSLDPKKIGVMYLIVSTIMLLRGLADAGLIRIQQALSSGGAHGVVSSDHFQQVFTAHGTIMIFFVAMGVIFGLMNLLIPL